LIGAQSYFAGAVFAVGASIFLFSLTVSYFFNAFGAGIAFVLAEVLLLIAFMCKYKRVAGG
jgi:PST family polysaccharide transporter